MTKPELDRAYASFYVDSHPDSFVIRNNPGTLAYYEELYHIPADLIPYETYADGDTTVRRYRYRNSIQFGDKAAYFCFKTVETEGNLTYELDLA